MRFASALSLAFVLGLSSAVDASALTCQVAAGGAQEKRTATVTNAAPLHAWPPPAPGLALRTIPAETVVVILGERDGWLNVEYVDAERARHVGWAPRAYFTIARASVPPPKPPVPSQPTVPPPPPPPPPTPPPTPPATRPEPAPPRAVPQRQAQPASPRPRARLAISASAGWEATGLAAVETFQALLGSSRVAGISVGGEVDGLFRGLFVRGSVGRSRDTGERAFVIDGTRVPVGIPIRITMMPIEATAGWRYRPRSRTSVARYSLHAGAGLVVLRYAETTTEFAEPEDNVQKTFPGFVLHGGASFDVTRRLFLTGDLRLRHIATPRTEGTLSADLGEDNLGGVAVRVGVGIRIRR